MSKLHTLFALEQIQLVKCKKISVEELLRDHLTRIKKIEPNIHAWTHLYPEVALKYAKEIDTKIQNKTFSGSFFGIPIGIKDVFNTFDMPTEMGSSLWEGFNPGNDARVVSILRQEGAIFPGKTVTAEFAVHAPGPTQNPHRLGYMTGTSSSGSAAAVASYMVPVALGTQSAGSTLRPASYCGVYGFKPSFGLLPRTGMLKTTDTLDHVGLLARSIEDIIFLFDVLRVRGEDYPFVHQTLDQHKQTKNKDYKIAFVIHPKWEFAEPYARSSIRKFIEGLGKDSSFIIEETKLPHDFYSIHEIHERIYERCLAYYFHKESAHPGQLSGPFLEMMKKGKYLSLNQYQKDLREQDRISRKLDNWFKVNKFDVAITLTTGGEAMKGLDTVDRPDSCLIWTFCGVPAISIPLFQGPLGLPFGLQIVSKKYNDYELLEFARNFIL